MAKTSYHLLQLTPSVAPSVKLKLQNAIKVMQEGLVERDTEVRRKRLGSWCSCANVGEVCTRAQASICPRFALKTFLEPVSCCHVACGWPYFLCLFTVLRER